MDQSILLPLFTFLVCYVIGSMPTAYLIGRINRINIFQIGSGNMGAANAIRAMGMKWGVLVWIIDTLKGVLAVALAWNLPGAPLSNGVIGAIAVVIGHNWSFIAALITGKIRGGKGAATAGGTWLILMAPWWQIIVITLSLWGAIVLLTRYVSLAVLVSVGIGTIWVMVLISQGSMGIPSFYAFYILIVGSMIFYRHRENIKSLLAGRERRLGERAH
ncbi:MAG: glycerol-3-phosphate 1-O-acyltransferase PlsY [Anaerolineae bacterium]|nr:glycerol-3-phosphate 1-O-acyltransferase PlsY [Anaerolineae bacterium]